MRTAGRLRSTDVAPAVPTGLVPRCFEVVEATDTSAWHLLLEDLTDSHFIATEWALPPTLTHCESIIEAQALPCRLVRSCASRGIGIALV
jgi:hypothetical protein